jgi:predicted Zn-dependent protease
MRAKISLLLVGSLLATAALGLFIWKGVPFLLRGLVGMVPVSWEERLGETVAGTLGRAGEECENPEMRQGLAEIEGRLTAAMPRNPYRFRVRVIRDPEVNAFAAPGGYVVLFSGLVEKMDSAEQLAGVMAHEMQHVVQRHSTQAMARALGLQLFFAIVLGDPGGLTGLAGNLGLLHFMRSDERSADEAALEILMRAGINPGAMVDGFRKLRQEGDDSSPALKYLSTHPPIEERIEYLRERSRAWKGPEIPFRFRVSGACAGAR